MQQNNLGSPTLRSRVSAVLFDLDNTLYNRDLAFRSWAAGFVDEQFPAESPAYRAEALDQMIVIDADGYTTKKSLFEQFKAIYPSITTEIETLCQRFYHGWLIHMALDPGTKKLLDFLDSSGIPFGIITNGPATQHLKIDQMDLRRRTSCLFVSEEFGCAKPDPAIFRAAASCLNTPCDRILFVGDNPHADIHGAHGVGMTTAWLPCGADWPAELTEVRPDYTLASLDELHALLSV